jgi:hypothetical protein
VIREYFHKRGEKSMGNIDSPNIVTNFDDWDRTLNNFVEIYLSQENSNEHDGIIDETSTRLHQLFLTALFAFIEEGNFKDKWFYSKAPNMFRYGQSTTVRSEKLGINIDFGVYLYEFFLNCHFVLARHIPSMDDTFWKLILELQSLGNMEFAENAVPLIEKVSEADRLMRYNKSQIFRLIRNYIFLEGDVTDFGALEVKWGIRTSLDTLLANGSIAFRNLYRINYLLFRAEYMVRRGHKKLKK